MKLKIIDYMLEQIYIRKENRLCGIILNLEH